METGLPAERLAALLGRDDDSFLASLRLKARICRFTPECALHPVRVESETLSVLRRIRQDQRELLHWRSLTAPALSWQTYTVRPVPPAMALLINRCFHYLGTPREGLTLGLFASSSRELPPAVSMTFSEFDLRSVAPFLPASAPPPTVLVLSRVYAFPWAVPNSFSFGFRRAAAWLKQNSSDPRLLLTYVNPNLGFTGASYSAANWLEARTGGGYAVPLSGRRVHHLARAGKALWRPGATALPHSRPAPSAFAAEARASANPGLPLEHRGQAWLRGGMRR